MFATVNPDPEYWGECDDVEAAFKGVCKALENVGFELSHVTGDRTNQEEWYYDDGEDEESTEEFDWFTEWCESDGSFAAIEVKYELIS
jgi:hypothetical protein